MRARFDDELEELNNDLIRMGMLCENAIQKSSAALFGEDEGKGPLVPEICEEINEEDKKIESLCLNLLLRQQPVAKDLRVVSAGLKMITDLNRIGTQSMDILEITRLDTIKQIPDTVPLKEMADTVIKMVSESIDAFVKSDIDLARKVIKSDDRADDLFDEIKQELVNEIRRKSAFEGLPDLLIVAKYFERIGDHAVRVAGWVTFAITGVREGVKK